MNEQIREEIKPAIERALLHEPLHEYCPIVVTDVQTEDARTFVVLRDDPETFSDQMELAWGNYQPCIKMARAILAIEEHPDHSVEASAFIARSEGKVAVDTSAMSRISTNFKLAIEATMKMQRAKP